MLRAMSLRRTISRVGPFVVAGWFAAVVVSYAAEHLHPVAALSRVLVPALFAVVLVGAMAGAGRSVLRALDVDFEDHGILWPVAFASGALLLSIAVFLLGIAGLWSVPALFVLVAAVSGWGWQELVRRPPGVACFHPLLRAMGSGALLPRVASLSLSAAAAAVVVLSLVPSFHYDALVDHLAIPRYWLLSGGIVPMPDNLLSLLPKQTEMLYAACLALSSDLSANLVHGAMGLATAMLLLTLGVRWGGATAGLLAAFGYLVAHKVILTASVAMVDAALAFYATAAAAVLLACGKDERWNAGRLLAAGVLAGGCLGVKYMGGPVLVLAAVWLASSLRERSTRAPLGPAASMGVFAAAALVPGAPYLARNWALSGDPFYPFAAEIFGMTGEAAAVATRFVASHAPDLSAAALLRLPWDFFMHEDRFHFGSLGPYLLAAFPALFLARPLPPQVRWCLGGAIALTVVWAATSQQMRYLFAAFPLFSLAAGWALGRATEGSRLLRGAVVAVLCLHAFITFDRLAATARIYFDPLGVLCGVETREEFLSGRVRSLRSFPILHACEDPSLPPGSILLVGESQAFYAPRLWVGGSADDRPWLARVLSDAADVDSIEAAMRAGGIGLIVVNRPEMARLEKEYAYFTRPGSRELWESYLRLRCRLEGSRNSVDLWSRAGTVPDS